MRESLRVPASRAGLKLLFTLFLSFLGMTSVSAQTIIPPDSLENIFYSPAAAPQPSLNSAVVDYTYNSTLRQLMAVTWIDATSAYCVINDEAGSILVENLPIPAGCTGCTISGSDVVLGGTNDITETKYYIGIAYNVTDGSGNSNVWLLPGTISNPGNSMSTSFCSAPINISNVTGTGIAPAVHIDIIAKDDGMGNVSADNFIITWAQVGSVADVFAAYCSSGLAAVASGCSFSASPVNITSLAGTHGNAPDVAAVEQSVSGGVDDFGLFSYTTQASPGPGLSIEYLEWDATTNTIISGPTSIFSNNNSVFARIDGIDCHTENDPGIGYAIYDIVGAYLNTNLPTNIDIVSYNSITGLTQCSTGVFASAPSAFAPSVACAPGMQYTISYRNNNNSSSDIYSQIVDWPTGNLSSNYYRADSITNNNPVVTSSGAVNNLVPDNLFVCWYNSFTGNLYYKISANPLVYKPTSVNTTMPGITWQLSPNPATDYLYLTASATDIQNTSYTITDITGRTMQQAAITAARQQVSISDLPPGMYMLNVYEHEAALKTIKFVKE